MIEDIYFLVKAQVRITAACIGISKTRWVAINEDDNIVNNHINLMEKKRFDHLPIINKNGTITKFYKTSEPNNFKNIKQHTISYEDIIPLDTNIKEVIEKFATNKRTFYFLSYHRNISGLITLGNLNCKEVQIYLYSLICELERELAEFLNSCFTNEQVIVWAESKQNKEKQEDKYTLILKDYNQLKKSDLENNFTEHLFLVDFFKIISEKELFTKLSYSKCKWKKLSRI